MQADSSKDLNHQVKYLYDINHHVDRYRTDYSELQRIKNSIHYTNLRSRSRTPGEQQTFARLQLDISRLEKNTQRWRTHLSKEHGFNLEAYLEACKKNQSLTPGDYILQLSTVASVPLSSFIPVTGMAQPPQEQQPQEQQPQEHQPAQPQQPDIDFDEL